MSDASAPPRDPRLVHRQNRPLASPPTKNGSLDSQGPSSSRLANSRTAYAQPWKQPLQSGEERAKIISDLTLEAATIARIQSEIDKVLKKKAKTDLNLQRAKNHPGFPAMIDHCEQTSEEEKNELRLLNEEKRQHESRHRQLEKALPSSLEFAFSYDPSELEERLARLAKDYEEKATRLQNEWEAKLAKYQTEAEGKIAALETDAVKAKAAATDAEKRATQAANTNQTLADAVRSVQDQLEQLQKSGANHSTPERNAASISGTNHEITSPQALAVSQLREEIDNLTQRVITLGLDIQPMASFRSRCLKMFDEFDQASEEKVEDIKTNTLEPLRKWIFEDISNRLDSLKPLNAGSNNASPETMDMVENVKRRLQDLEEDHAAKLNRVSENLGQIQGLQSMQSGMLDEEFGNFKKRLDEHAEEFKSLKQGYSQVSDDLKKLEVANSVVKQNVAGISGTVENARHVLETVRTGLHSLETRWNNLSTEPIVRNMIAAMQEMYPSADKFQEQLANLRMNTVNSIKTINEQTSRLTHVQTTQEQRLLQLSGRFYEIDSLFLNLTGLQESFKTHQDNVQQPIKDLADLQTKLEALEKQLEEHGAKLGELGADGKTHAASLHELEQERGALDTVVKDLARQGEDLATELGKAKAGNAENAEEVKAHTAKLNEFLDRVAEVETSATQRELAFGSRMQLLEESIARKGQALREELDQMKGCEESRKPLQSSLQHDNLRAPVPSQQQTEPTAAAAIPEKKKKKKKRPRPSTQAEDDTGSVLDSPATHSVDGTPVGAHGEKRRKKKKRLKTQDMSAVQ